MDETKSTIPFSSERFGTIRAMSVSDEPWFVSKDVCNVLGEARRVI